MATLQQLETALINADKAGDMEAARRLAGALVEARKNPANQIPDTQVSETMPDMLTPSALEQVAGAGEAALTLGTGAIGGTVGMVGGAVGGLAQQILSGQFGTPEAVKAVEKAAAQGGQALTYMPRGQAGQENVQAVGQALQGLPAYIPIVGPAAGTIGQATRQAALPAQATMQSLAQRGSQAIAPAMQRMAQAPGAIREGLGMAPAAPTAQAAATGGRAAGGAAATPLELQRFAEAEKAGLRLSEGEMKRSPELIAFEAEKAKTPDYQAPFLERQQENNRAALANLESLIDSTGAEAMGAPNDFSNTGIKVVDTLMKGWNDEKAKTRALYNKFKTSDEALETVDATPLIDFLNVQTKNIPGITGVSDAAAQNAVKLGVATMTPDGQLQAVPTTLGQLEQFRESVSAIGANSPNDKRLASLLKRNIDAIGDPIAGPMLNAMRGQRRTQATKYENRAIVSQLLLEKKGMSDRKTPIEDVFRKTILTARPSEITHIKRVLYTIGGDEGKQAWKELQGATVRHLLESAESGIGADNLPVISGAKLNKAVKALDANNKMEMVLGKEAAENIRNLNQVLQYIQTTPPLTSINNSGTARTVAALIAESAVQGATFGVPLPILQGMKMLKDNVRDKKIKARIQKALNYRPTGTGTPTP
jgi:hypothetical protein